MALQTYLLFFLRDVIDRNLEAGILKDDTFHDKGASVFVDCDGHTLFVFSPRALLLVLVDEMNDVFQFADGEYFLCTLLKSEFFPYEDAYIDRAALPNALQTLGAGVFTDCKNMESINMQRTQVKNILRNTYSGCSGITTFYYPNVVETIGEFAFSGCSALVGSFFPASLTSIETNAFHLCTKMSQVYCLGSTPPTLGTAAFDSSLKSISTLFVPEAAISAYSSSSWNPYFKEIKKDLLHP